ncbi:hypothetical protein CLV58_13146 [Spirosoma oryzae]|uniref:Uncharacterized protein n=1 Tax=Spirosoma oryzae TaxID=1469603 RepID=A0A2T0S330_9BACT|nr:hypothetical protein CLV58_13146 [Spirosoma oryzae]
MPTNYIINVTTEFVKAANEIQRLIGSISNDQLARLLGVTVGAAHNKKTRARSFSDPELLLLAQHLKKQTLYQQIDTYIRTYSFGTVSVPVWRNYPLSLQSWSDAAICLMVFTGESRIHKAGPRTN